MTTDTKMITHSHCVLPLILAAVFGLALGVDHISGQDNSKLVEFHIPGDDSTGTATSFAHRVPAEIDSSGFVTIRNGKFHLGDKRQRFWGVNLCFGACFPTHEEATKIAAHFRKLGMNIVRFHHMDMQDAPSGIWRTRENGIRELDPGQIDKLDFFLNELHKNGIYANINLHVSRTLTEAEGFPVLPGANWWMGSNKWVMYYDPDVQAKLKEYCRDLLTHENPYRKRKRVDDPGVAMVEMLNENYFSLKGTELLAKLDKKYVDSFIAKWNQWLSKKYSSHDAMIGTWKSAQEPMGRVLVAKENWTEGGGKWAFEEQVVSMNASFGIDPPKGVTQRGLRLVPSAKAEKAHYLKMRMGGLSVESGKDYTLKLWARADNKRSMSLELSTSQGGQWRDLDLFETVQIDSQWTEIRRVVSPRETINGEVNLQLNFGLSDVPVEIAGAQLQEGIEQTDLDPDQSLAKMNVGVPDVGWPAAAHQDLKTFLVETERAWIVELKDYLTDLGVKVPITASQENYHAPGLLAGTVDFVDLHNYWHHPTFPGDAEWSETNWRVEHEAIEANPTRMDWPANSLLMRTGWRYFDMPFTLSEWNQGEPNDRGSGAIMMAAILGSIQDWDGVMFFNYSDRHDRWFSKHYKGWFDFNGHPTKLAVLATAGNIFLRGDLEPLQARKKGTFGERVDGRMAFDYQVGVDTKADTLDSFEIGSSKKFETPDGRLLWDATNPRQAFIRLKSDRTVGVWGLIANNKFQLPGMQLAVRQVANDYATVVLTSQDGKPISSSRSMLLLASSGSENTGMKWNQDRNSVGTDWGTGPTLINPVSMTLTIKPGVFSGTPKVWALSGTGERRALLPNTILSDGSIEWVFGPAYKTIWYEILVE